MSGRDWRLLALFAASFSASEAISAFIGTASWILPVTVSMFVFTMTVMARWLNGVKP